MKTRLWILHVLLVRAISGCANEQGSSQREGALSDAQILAIYGQVNGFDVETAALGEERAESAEVRSLAMMVRSDHQAVLAQTDALAAELELMLALPASRAEAARAHREAVARLETLVGEEFDDAYLAYETTFHEDAISAVEHVLMPAASPRVRAFLADILPGFEHHLAETRRIVRERDEDAGEAACVDAAGAPGTALRAEDRVFPAELDFGFVRFAPGWGDFQHGPHGTFGILPAHTETPPHVHTAAYDGVVIKGTVINPFGTEQDAPPMGAGSFWHVPGGAQHVTRCDSSEECWIYIYGDAGFDFEPIAALSEPRSAEAQVVLPEQLAFTALAPFVSFATARGDFAHGPHGSFAVFPGGAASPAHVHSGEYHGVMIRGLLENPFAAQSNPPMLAPGSLGH